MPKLLLAPVCWRVARVICLVCGITLAAAASAQQLSHAPDPLFHDGFAGVTAGPFNDSDAARFLAQATFGPTDADIAHLRQVGYQAWLTEQFNATTTPPTHEIDYLNWVSNTLHENVESRNRLEAWFLGALGGPDPAGGANHTDQLRQRVAFALSEILVVSDQNPLLSQFPGGVGYYYDVLTDNAFGNYRTLLEKVTLSPAMGVYLNMIENVRADTSQNMHPDENYAREINQLFSIGLVMLDIDGTPKVPSTPTYTQSTVTAFAHVFTGWTWSDCTSSNFHCGPDYNTGGDFVQPMIAFDSYHDNGTDTTNDLPNKKLLDYGQPGGGMLANGGTPQSDLTFALDNIVNHPNVGPFISKELIQRLVTSNPSPAYVQRVAMVFNDDGTGTRGNLKAVLQAILLDPEARYGQWRNPDTFGKLREPLLALTHFWRAMHAVHHCGNDFPNSATPPVTFHYANQPYRYAGNASNTADTIYETGVAQAPVDADTVFNFFKPSYLPPGEMTTRNLLGPEFQITTDTTITNTSNSTKNRAFNTDTSDVCGGGTGYDIGDVAIDHTQDASLAGNANGGPTDPADRLVDAYNKRFMSGQMSPFMRQTLLTYLNQIDSTQGADWKTQRIQFALYLIFTSPEYVIQK